MLNRPIVTSAAAVTRQPVAASRNRAGKTTPIPHNQQSHLHRSSRKECRSQNRTEQQGICCFSLADGAASSLQDLPTAIRWFPSRSDLTDAPLGAEVAAWLHPLASVPLVIRKICSRK